MGVNRVDLADETLIDITDSTVNSNNLMSGAVAYGADGERVVGSVVTADVVDNLTSTSTEDALSANQGRVLNGKITEIYDNGYASYNLVSGLVLNSSFNSSTGEIVEEYNYKLAIAKVIEGETYTFRYSTSTELSAYAFYTSKPEIGSVSYNGSVTSLTDRTGIATVVAPISGYLAFRVYKGFSKSQCEKGSTLHDYSAYAMSNSELTEAMNNKADKSSFASKGSATKGIYFDASGVATEMDYSLEKSVPSNAVFTDTWRGVQDNLTSTSTEESLSAKQGKILNDTKINNPTTKSANQVLTYNGTEWVAQDTQSVPELVMTKAQWDAYDKSSLTDNTKVTITDDNNQPTMIDTNDLDITTGLLKLSNGVKQKLSELEDDVDEITEELSAIVVNETFGKIDVTNASTEKSSIISIMTNIINNGYYNKIGKKPFLLCSRANGDNNPVIGYASFYNASEIHFHISFVGYNYSGYSTTSSARIFKADATQL